MTSTDHCRPSGCVGWLLAGLLAIPALAAIVPSPAHSEARIVRVGLQSNPLLVFPDESGRAGGIFVDMLQFVAARQDWKLQWVPCKWSACLAKLADAEIDLMGAVAYSAERERRFDFTRETVFNNWAAVIRTAGGEINSITDLEGLRVATAKGSIHTRALHRILESFNIQSHVVEVNVYADVAQALQAGEASVGIVNRLNLLKFARLPGIEKTSIIFNPVELRFATAKGSNSDLRVAIDQTMSALKADKSSVYYASLEKWLFAKDQRIVVPVWLWWVLGGSGGVLLMLFAFNQVLRAKVKRATASLEEARDNLEKQVEERTRELIAIDDRLRLSIELMPIAYIVWDSDFKVVDWNPAAERTFGFTKDEMHGKSPLDTIVPEDARPFGAEAIERLLAGEEAAYSVSGKNLRKDGEIISCLWFNTPLTNQDGTTLGALSMAIDVTERKKIEDQLRQAQKMRTIGQLAGGVAHEFNNLLQVVMSNLDMLRDYPGDEAENAEMLDVAIAASTRGGELTQQLLSFSRKKILSPKVININDSLSGISRLLQGTLGEEITLKTKFAKDLASVDIDSGSFESAILNLVLNAHSAMPKGGTATIETTNVDMEKAIPHDDGDLAVGQYVVVTVSDSGCGMSPEVLERAFEPFFTTRDVGQGTGLGLSIVYGFSKQSGGYTTIDSEPGKGTTVRMYLPIAEAEAIEEPDQPEHEKAETKGSGTVLVVEDDLQVLKATVRFLKQIGYEASGAGDGPSALAILQQRNDIDLVISDVIMPNGMSGIDLAEEIQRKHKGVKVILMSGYPISEIDQDGTLEERYEIMRKPYSNDQLAAAVKAAIEG